MTLKINFALTLFLSGILLLASCNASKQSAAGNEPVATSIDSSRWVFTVQTINPQQGMNTQPNGLYSVIYKDGTLNVYLPYFGRAFSGADINQGRSALDFISKDFSVEKEQTGEGKWRIIFKPNDQRQVQSMTFVFYNNGSGSLDIIMTNRSPIGYRGIVSRSK